MLILVIIIYQNRRNFTKIYDNAEIGQIIIIFLVFILHFIFLSYILKISILSPNYFDSCDAK
ncbi:hypothetical protein RIR_e52701_A0A2N1NW08_9GLOM [Rhizophagus irregularis DAOM 181602=DAOM 197198]|nr:hypothetical protein RIR_e52701_A0A2N1NW08_9GLOM [Rhizophagus irregularis DAOM 181602=DAOM 197198]